MATATTDPRVAPSTMDPTRFTFIENFYVGGSDDVRDEYAYEHRHLMDLFGDDSWTQYATGQCASCGAYYGHGSLYRYDDGDYFGIGHTCASEYFSQPSVASLKQYRAAKRRATRERREAGDQWLAENVGEAMDLYEQYHDDTPYEARYFVRVFGSMLGNARRYGSLTERQTEFVHKLVDEVYEKVAARRAIEETATVKMPVPETGERVQVTGTVLTVKWQDSPFGYNAGSLKMLVADPRGFKVWGTVPNSISSIYDEDGAYARSLEKGDRVTFTAQVERSAQDDYFGYFKRPTKASVLVAAETPQV